MQCVHLKKTAGVDRCRHNMQCVHLNKTAGVDRCRHNMQCVHLKKTAGVDTYIMQTSHVFLTDVIYLPSKHAGSDPEAFLLRPVMAIRASVQPESGRTVYAGSYFPNPFQLRFSKEGMDHIVQNRPGSDLDGVVRVWAKRIWLEAILCAGIIGPGFWQGATGPLPVSHFQARFRSPTDVPDNIVQNQAGFDLVLADCIRVVAKQIRSGSKPVCKNHPARSGQCFPADPARMRIGSNMFTGITEPKRHPGHYR